ncbi:MAG: T9SS type A sorting domain-containing protein [Hymenobacter sp.]|nr:MAG: T9SS type A sorting domain-containing protein [Hymenobacter sp.]
MSALRWSVATTAPSTSPGRSARRPAIFPPVSTMRRRAGATTGCPSQPLRWARNATKRCLARPGRWALVRVSISCIKNGDLCLHMKKSLLFWGMLLGLAPAIKAQSSNPAVWCPIGATWTYGYGLFTEEGTMTVRYVRDTLVAGQSAQLFARRITSHDRNYPSVESTHAMPSVVTRTVADRVEVLANGQFYTLYDFGAQPGNSWLTPRVIPVGPCPAEVVRATVDSVGTQLVAGRQLRWFRVHLTAPAGGSVVGGWPGRIYEQLGNLYYMQPQSPTCAGTDPGAMGPFSSYKATGWPTISFYHAAGTLLATAQARAATAGFTVFPNPSAGVFTLQLPLTLAPTATLHLCDLLGRTLQRLPVPASRQLDVRSLPAGTYTLLLLVPGQSALAPRVVVE